MSRYHQAPYSDGAADYGNSPQHYGNGGGYADDANQGYRGNDYPMSSSNPYATTSSAPRGYNAPKKSRKKLWWIIGALIALLVIAGAVLGGVFGSRAANKNKNNNSASGNDKNGGSSGTDSDPGSNSNFPAGSAGAKDGNTALPSMLSFIGGTNLAAQTQTGANGANDIYVAVATDAYMLPAYATGTATAGLAAPTSVPSPSANGAWPGDDAAPSGGAVRAHPRIIAPSYKWEALKNGLIANDPYLAYWNATIVANASATLDTAPTAYTPDGGLTGSGVLDVAREIKMKVKNWAYAFQITGDTRYRDRVWNELRTASGNNPDISFGDGNGRWNGAGHFLDLAEFTAAFAIGFDWLYDQWTPEQRTTLVTAIVNLGLQYGHNALTGTNGGGDYNWWSGVAPGKGSNLVDGNWNCVCNGGLILGAIAVLGEEGGNDSMANDIITMATGSAKENCFKGAYADGTWAETPNYWYFGTTGAAEMTSALTTAFGDDKGLDVANNANFGLTSIYHMYVQGMTSLFNYGDHGPNKFSATANSLMLWGSLFSQPRFTLYQRDHYDASEPYSMFWYDPAVEGAWWSDLEVDKHFDDPKGEWATGRSSWTDNSGTYWAMKGGRLTGHQTHGNLDLGDFVIDAMGQRWAGELGSDQYLGANYFSNEDQDSARWNYYRTRTEGQNTILINNANQLVTATAPSTKFESSGTKQGVEPFLQVGKDDTAYFTMDMSSAYGSGVSVKRGIRFLNSRQQILVQDEISGVPTGQPIQWRMQTNATFDGGSASATLSLGGRTLVAQILNPTPAGLTFGSGQATYSGNPANAMSNDGTHVLTITNDAGGDMSLQVLFTPQWPDKQESDYVTPGSLVALDSWSLTSHN